MREESYPTIIKVRVSVIPNTLSMLLELTQMDERETHFREVFLLGVLQARGVCRAKRPSQS
jgi:hypothetical protein